MQVSKSFSWKQYRYCGKMTDFAANIAIALDTFLQSAGSSGTGYSLFRDHPMLSSLHLSIHSFFNILWTISLQLFRDLLVGWMGLIVWQFHLHAHFPLFHSGPWSVTKQYASFLSLVLTVVPSTLQFGTHNLQFPTSL